MGTEEFQDPTVALTELRARLEAARVALRLDKTMLARRADLGRTTVSEAFSNSAPPPSTQTLGALADALRLELRPLLELRAVAAGETAESSTGDARGAESDAVGRPIADWDPHDLEVHPAADAPPPPPGSAPASTAETQRPIRALPMYVRRPHDEALAELVTAAADGASRMAVLVGSSSTGKTRACWEAVQPLAELGWRLWHPIAPTRADSALADLGRVAPRTVVWLNEAQHYLGAANGVGERIAAALRTLLTDPARGPVLILATLWPKYVTAYTVLPDPDSNRPDPHAQVRKLLAGRLIPLPDAFDAAALDAARALADAGDQQLAHALPHTTGDGRLAQFLAGAPELLRRYHIASPAARALLEAAMDARRLGVGLHLSLTFLVHAAEDYLTDDEYDTLNDNWLEQALAETSEPVHGNLAPLRRVNHRPIRRTADPQEPEASSSPSYRLADYLEQHGRHQRWRLCPPASFWQAAHAHLTHPDDLGHLASAAQGRHRLYWAHHLWRKAASTGNSEAMFRLASMLEQDGDREDAQRLYRQAADTGDINAMVRLASMLEQDGDREDAQRLYRQIADAWNNSTSVQLASMLKEPPGRKGIKHLARQAARTGDTDTMVRLASMLEQDGDREDAQRLYRQAADTGSTYAMVALALELRQDGDREGAQRLYRQVSDSGDNHAMVRLARLLKENRDREGVEYLARLAADAGNTDTMVRLASMLEQDGDREGAQRLYRQAADTGATRAMVALASMLERTGDREGAQRLYRQAADAGGAHHLPNTWAKKTRDGKREPLWPYGLDPDGTPSTSS